MSERRSRQLVDEGKLPVFHRTDRLLLFREQDVQRLAHSRRRAKRRSMRETPVRRTSEEAERCRFVEKLATVAASPELRMRAAAALDRSEVDHEGDPVEKSAVPTSREFALWLERLAGSATSNEVREAATRLLEHVQ